MPKVGFKARGLHKTLQGWTERGSRKARGRGIRGDPTGLGPGPRGAGCRGGGWAEEMWRLVLGAEIEKLEDGMGPHLLPGGHHEEPDRGVGGTPFPEPNPPPLSLHHL